MQRAFHHKLGHALDKVEQEQCTKERGALDKQVADLAQAHAARFSVSSRASGAVTSTSEAIAVTPMSMAAMGMLRVRNSATLKTAMTPTER